MPTFKTEELRLVVVSNVQLVKRLLLCNERQIQHYLALRLMPIMLLKLPIMLWSNGPGFYPLARPLLSLDRP